MREEMNRADRLQAGRRRPPRQHRRVRAHRAAAPAGVQPGGDLQSLDAAATGWSAAAERCDGRGRVAATEPAQPLATCSAGTRPTTSTSSTTSPSGELEELEDEVVDAATAAQTAAELEHEIAHARRPGGAGRAGPRTRGTDRKWTELRDLLHDERADPRRGREPPQDDHLHRAPRHARTTSPSGSAACSAGPRRSSTIHGGVRREERREVQESFRQDPDGPGAGRDRRGRRGPEPAARAPDGQLRPAVEPEPDRAAVRPHPPDRPDRGLPPVEPGRRRAPAKARCSSGCWRRWKSSAQT